MSGSPLLAASRPRLAVVGAGWIGCSRLEALVKQDIAEVVVIADPLESSRQAAQRIAPTAVAVARFDGIFEHALDGVVVATPSALHAAQASAVLERGLAVFCQKPLARNALEAASVVEHARAANRLLGLDLCYRHTRALRGLKRLVKSNELGEVYAMDLTFHNAYGPDKPWYYDRALAGGGALCDLGVHLIDLALWLFDFPEASKVCCQLRSRGAPVSADPGSFTEDYASLQFELGSGASVRLACSWNLPAGMDASIGVAVYGTGGGARMRNVGGSFYDFVLERFERTKSHVLFAPPDDWGGRALCEWAWKLSAGHGYDTSAERYIEVQRILDEAYRRGGPCAS